MPPKEKTDITLEPGESLRHMMIYNLESPTNPDFKKHLAYLIIDKNGDTYARVTEIHETMGELCGGHCTEIMEGKGDQTKMMLETMEKSTNAILQLSNSNPDRPMFKKTSPLPIFKASFQRGETLETIKQYLNGLSNEYHFEKELTKKIIGLDNTLDLVSSEDMANKGLAEFLNSIRNQDTQPNNNQEEPAIGFKVNSSTLQLTPQDNNKLQELEGIEKLKKAAEEEELIKKYGKRNIEKLAKKMNYKGIKINNKTNE